MHFLIKQYNYSYRVSYIYNIFLTRLIYHREKEVTWDPREAEEKKEPWYVILKSNYVRQQSIHCLFTLYHLLRLRLK